MKTCDLYGFSNDNLELVRIEIEQALGLRLAAHESLYHGGDYYRLGSLGQEHFILQRNIDLIDNEPLESEFPEMKVLLYVNETERPEELELLLTTKVTGLQLLRRHEL
jgi:hypothetical protein